MELVTKVVGEVIHEDPLIRNVIEDKITLYTVKDAEGRVYRGLMMGKQTEKQHHPYVGDRVEMNLKRFNIFIAPFDFELWFKLLRKIEKLRILERNVYFRATNTETF